MYLNSLNCQAYGNCKDNYPTTFNYTNRVFAFGFACNKINNHNPIC